MRIVAATLAARPARRLFSIGESMSDDAVLKTPLHALHVELGARMAPFAGYDMPIQYPAGVMAEHLQTRKSAGLFDVSHMGQALIEGADHRATAAFLETLCPADILNLAPGRQRYTQFLNDDGGVVDDLMVTRPPGADGVLRLVVNASRKAVDYELVVAHLPAGLRLTPLEDAALIALQGPLAAATLARLAPGQGLESMAFMSAKPARVCDVETFISRSGYTGEDGYEISLPAAQAEVFARRLLAEADIAPVGLGARDSLRLEAGLCLYGHELDETVDPVEAVIAWSIPKRRRAEAGFPGAGASCGRWPRDHDASASESGPTVVRRRATERRSSRLTAPRSGSSPQAVSVRASARQSPWASSTALTRRRDAARADRARQEASTRGSRPCLSILTPIIAADAKDLFMAEIRYTKDHEYIRIDGAEGVVGISDHAQSQLGDVVFAEVPPLGKTLKAGDPAAVVESVKAASDVFAPVVRRDRRSERRASRRRRA